jgi:putative ABC transport system permease protein
VTGRPLLLRFVEALLVRRLSPQRAEFLLGDLEEEFHRRSARSRLGAAAWLVKQAVVCRLAAPRFNRPDITPDRGFIGGAVRRLFRESARSFRARPLLTATCIAIMALGIGSTTAVTSAVYALLVRPLPLPNADRLVTGFALREGFDPFGTSILEFSAFRARGHSFESTGLARQQTSTLRLGNDTIRVQSAAVTFDYLSTAGVRPSLGRAMTAGDDRPGAAPVALIGHALWRTRLAGRAEAVGSTLVVDGRPTTIIGVLPPGFDLPFAAEVWMPLQLVMEALPIDQRLPSAYAFIARLRETTAIDTANREAAVIAAALAEEYPQRRGWTYRLLGLRRQLIGDLDGATSRVIALVAACVAFLLAICCVNVANLLLLRAVERRRDEAVRLALGASPRQLALEQSAEHVLIGLAGGAAGLMLAVWMAPALAALNPVRAAAFAPVLTDFRVDGVMLAIGAGMSLIAAVVIAVVPKARLSPRVELAATLMSSGTRAGVSRASKVRLRVLVAAQIAAAVVLLVGSGLVLRSFDALRRMELGFEPRGLVSVEMTLPPLRYTDHRARHASLERLLDSVRTIPGVVRAGITTNIPMQPVSFDASYTAEGAAVVDPNNVPITAHRVVTPEYLRLLGVRLVRGRLLAESDAAEASRVVVISEELARQAWPGQDPIGRRIRRGRSTSTNPWLTVVGVVADVKEDRFNYRIDRAVWYLPYAQEDSPVAPNLVVECRGDGAAVIRALRERVRTFDPDIGLSEAVSIESHVAELLSTERFAAVLLATLAASGLLLAVLGLYGAISHGVSTQRTEIALRLAVGAPRGRVVAMIVREVALVALGGAAIGTVLAALGSLGLGGVLFQIEPHDAPTYAGVALLIVVASGLAACAPAVRAARVDPARLLR